MPIQWQPKINRLWGKIEEEEQKLVAPPSEQELPPAEYLCEQEAPPIEPEEELGAWERYNPFYWLEEYYSRPAAAAITGFFRRGLPTPPSPEQYEKWAKLPPEERIKATTQWEREAKERVAQEYEEWEAPKYLRGAIELGLEMPLYMAAPTAIAMRAGLVAKPWLGARVLAKFLTPIAKTEAVMARPMVKAAERITAAQQNRILKQQLAQRIQSELPSLGIPAKSRDTVSRILLNVKQAGLPPKKEAATIKRLLTQADLGLYTPDIAKLAPRIKQVNLPAISRAVSLYRPSPKVQRKIGNEVADNLTAYLSRVYKQKVLSPAEYQRAAGIRPTGWRARLWGKVDKFTAGSSRPERLLESIDRYIPDAPMQRVFYGTANNAWRQVWHTYIPLYDRVKVLGGRKGIQGLYDLVRRPIGQTLGAKELTSLDRIAIHLYTNQPTARRHLALSFGLPHTHKSYRDIAKVAGTITPEEKAIARELQSTVLALQSPIDDAYRFMWNKEMFRETGYFPVRVLRDPLRDIGWGIKLEGVGERRLAQMLFASGYPTARLPKGFTRMRVKGAINPLNLDVVDVTLRHIWEGSNFARLYPSLRDLQRLLGNKKLGTAIISAKGKPTYDQLEKWLIDQGSQSYMRVNNEVEAVIRGFRRNAIVSFLGWNVVTGMKQLASWMLGVTKSPYGFKGAMKGMSDYMAHPKYVEQVIKRKAPEVYARSRRLGGAAMEREIAEIAREAERAFGWRRGYWRVKDTATALIRATDKSVVYSLWYGNYREALARGVPEEKAIEMAHKLIRQTQPYFTPKDLAGYWRMGELSRMLTIFTNQLNQNWNYLLYDILGPVRAKTISKPEAFRRIMQGLVSQALIIGAINRSNPAMDVREVGHDLAFQTLSMFPLIGSWMSGGIAGFTESGVIPFEVLQSLSRSIYLANKGDWDKLGKRALPELAALGVGVPLSQPRRTIEGVVALAGKKSDDWLRLIWSEYVRERAGEEEIGLPERELPGRGLPSRELPGR